MKFTHTLYKLFAIILLCVSFTASAQTTATTPNYSGMWWSGPAESGWGMTLAHHKNASGNQMFAAFFIYAPDGKPFWVTVSGGTFSQQDRLFVGDLYVTTGPSYRLETFDPRQVTIRKAGTMSVSFTDDTHAMLSYSIDGVTVTKLVEKLDFWHPPYDSWPNDYSDMWWNASESGWGWNIAQNNDMLFGVWYGYREDGHPYWFVMSGGVWTTETSFTGTIYDTTGPSYTNPVFNTNNVVVRPIGQATMLVKNRDSMTFTFTANCTTKTRDVERLKFIANEQEGTMYKPSRLIAPFVIAAGIAGCGGGGGGSSGPSVGPGAATVAITQVTPANGATNVSVNEKPTLTFQVANGSYLSHTADFRCGGNPVAHTSSVAGSVITLTPSANLPLGQTCQISWSVSGAPSGNPPAQITQVFTTKSTMSYTDKVYVTYIGAYPYSVTKTGVAKVTNRTQFTSGFFPLFNCSLYEEPIENGIIPVQCTVASDNVRRTFYINPDTNELFQYTGTFTFDSTKFHDAPWGTSQPYGPNVGPLGWYAEVSDGIYWGSAMSDQKLRFSPKVGNGYDFNNVLVVAQASGVDFFKIIIKYNH